MHNLLLAHFMLRNHVGYRTVLERFEQFARSEEAAINDNVRAQTAIYLFLARLNGFFLEGNFKGGIAIVPELEDFLDTYPLQTDRHRVLVFYYKIACLYFVVGDFEKTIDYLNRIIHWKVDLRSDLQCYARLLHLIAHYELGNTALLEHLIKSVYRFMAKMENLSIVEEEIFKFIRKSFQLTSSTQIKTALGILLDRLKRCEGNRFESRSFMYLDFIGWLESKLAGVPLEAVIKSRMARKKG
jgi:hypothetical protein